MESNTVNCGDLHRPTDHIAHFLNFAVQTVVEVENLLKG